MSPLQHTRNSCVLIDQGRSGLSDRVASGTCELGRLAGTPVEDAVRSKDNVLVNMLNDIGARPSLPFLRTVLLKAAREGDIKTLQLLHSMNADLSVCNYDKV